MELAIGLALGGVLAAATLCALLSVLAMLERARAQEALGRGQLERGERSLSRSLAFLRVAALGRRTTPWARTAVDLALLRKILGRGEAARSLAETAAAVAEARRASREAATARALLCEIALSEDRRDDAHAEAARSLEHWRATDERSHALFFSCLHNLSHLMRGQARFKDALELARDAVREGERLEIPGTLLARAASNHGTLAALAGKREEAEAAYRKAVALREKAWGEKDPRLAPGLRELAAFLLETGRPEASNPVIERALALEALGPVPVDAEDDA